MNIILTLTDMNMILGTLVLVYFLYLGTLEREYRFYGERHKYDDEGEHHE